MALTESPVAVMLPISDPDRAQKFYSDGLGLQFDGINDEKSVTYRLGGGTELVLLPRPDQKPAESTAMSFEVSDIGSEVAMLEGRGIEFQDYDLPDLKTEGHICVMGTEKAAWFLDPDGNVLCLHETL
jgi:catechol 2,3-dioxygenase-like lactoylglutathione lyase family enzyme